MTIRRHLCQAEQRVLHLQSMGLWLLAPLPRRELVLHLEALMVGKLLRLDHVHALRRRAQQLRRIHVLALQRRALQQLRQ